MQTKRKTDLFRFITLRAPQLISKDRREVGLVEHPTPANSYFLTQFSASDDLATARAAVSAAASGFSPYRNVDEVKSAAGDYWAFASWLVANKSNLDRATAENKVPASALANNAERTLWDNVFYDLIAKKDSAIRQACLEVIAASAFQRKFRSNYSGLMTALGLTEEEILSQFANGSVVIPNAFTKAKGAVSSSGRVPKPGRRMKQEAAHKAFLAQGEADKLEAIKKDLCRLGKQYDKDYSESYASAVAQYDAQVSEAVSTYLRDKPLMQIPAEMTWEEAIEEHVTSDVIADFRFTFADPLAPEYTSGKVSQDTTDFINDNCLTFSSVSEAMRLIDRKKGKAKSIIGKKSRKEIKAIRMAGVEVKTSDSPYHDFAISFAPDTSRSGNYSKAFLSLHTKYNGAFIKSGSFRLVNGGQTLTSTRVKVMGNDSRQLFVELFSDKNIVLNDDTQLDFSGTFELSNGKQMSVGSLLHTSTPISSGRAWQTESTAAAAESVFGVNKIGVADYRRVEQELCCYVPGEVSHIENILAKEYKERSTRNLISSETRTETTDEREVEELTDTVTTNRFEMSSEVAEVINKDRQANFGFDASVDGAGTGFTYHVGGYGDFALSRSTSESNAQARSYAEDVTRRALERIVQKTTVKRTSTILKEFEENNRHGFDNRTGEAHVTGVYRWLDKVYKNRVVNYGKRLMYEFMVPEPARWYKEAVIIEAEESEDTGGGDTGGSGPALPQAPLHPSEYGMSTFRDIDRDNYDTLASHYNASVTTPMNATENVTGSFAASEGGKDKDFSYTYNDMVVPVDYECTNISGNVNYSYKRTSGKKGYIRLSSGGVSLYKHENISGKSSRSEPFSKSISNATGTLPVAINTKKITGFTASFNATCTLKNSVYEQWQQDVYDDIMNAYNAQLQAYNDAIAQDEADDAIAEATGANEPASISRNPKFNAMIVNTELKRLCIEMLTKPFGITQGKDFYSVGECDVPQINLGKDLDEYASHVKFFEQAFDWELMSYIFYAYYWAKKCDWKALFQSQDGNDHIFQAFLQSGMGRVVVPVREGFEKAVCYYLETGEIWNGTGIVIGSDHELYLSIVDELNQNGGQVEDEWETVVPSSLTLVQARSVLLNEEGLPCCESTPSLNLLADTNTLKLIDETP